jgi:glycosyltransferase involved in cell wall biosynthesis
VIIEPLLPIAVVSTATSVVMTVMGANLYDIRQLKFRQEAKKHPYKKQFRNRPVVTVVLLTHNDDDAVDACLEALLASSYRKLEILIVDNGSSDNSKNIIRDYARRYPKKVKLYARRVHGTTGAAIAAGLKKYPAKELLLPISADSLVTRHAITNIVRQHNIVPDAEVILPNNQVVNNYDLLDLMQSYEQILFNRANKLSVLFGSNQKNGYAMAYTRPAFRRWLHNEAMSYQSYASDAVIRIMPKQSRQWISGFLATRYRADSVSRSFLGHKSWPHRIYQLSNELTALMAPILVSYFIYLAYWLHQPALLLLSCAILIVYVGLAVAAEEALSRRQKINFLLLMPITFGWFYLRAIAKMIAWVKRLASGLISPRVKLVTS